MDSYTGISPKKEKKKKEEMRKDKKKEKKEFQTMDPNSPGIYR